MKNTRLLPLSSVAAWLALGGAFACSGESTNDAGPLDGGAPTSDAQSPDARDETDSGEGDGGNVGTGEPACDPIKPFEAPVEVSELNTMVSGSARLTPDMLTVYFHAGETDNGTRLYTASRATTSDPFGTPTLVEGLASDAGVGTAGEHASIPTLTPDQLGLFFQSRRPGGGGATINVWSGSRPSLDAPFTTPTPVAAINDALNTGQPFVSADGTSLYYSPRRGSGAEEGIRIYRASLSGMEVSSPSEVVELSSAERNEAPVVSADELTIYFARQYTIWSATRANKSSVFSNLAQVGIAKESGNDLPSWVSPDNCVLYLTSSRSGTNKIYTATRLKN